MFDLKPFSIPLEFPEKGYLKLLDAIGDAQIVCIGDSTHGTQDYYEHRAIISKLLIEHKGFRMIAVEADWPDCATVNKYIHNGKSIIRDPLANFTRFPVWMWRNEVMQSFSEWMKDWNSRNQDDDLNFYGLDVYSLQKSTEEVVKYLESVDPSAASKAKNLYKCFDKFHHEPLMYSLSIKLGIEKVFYECSCKGCQQEASFVMHHLFRKRLEEMGDDQFIAEINALVVKDAEEYYRFSVDENVNSWNIRDRHMFKILQRLMDYSVKRQKSPKVIVWAHNSHLGDARYTDMGKMRAEVNIGQLCRESDIPVYNVGFLCHEGTVMAANSWGTPGRVKDIVPSLKDSHEYFLHSNFPNQNVLLIFKFLHKQNSDKLIKNDRDIGLTKEMEAPRLERYIGVVYCPQSERLSHYSSSSLSNQFDAIVFMDRTCAIHLISREE